ncbi:mRNA (2'-O-methyladenosine-N(6)-)-methyltransferase-like isoform X2 [Corticium candelabrum]|nr:mRNA (2'-O-methyladenosine-N(6)-)-methyltransferase-like isoform X2 [Corticium candelabrum]
MVEPLDAKWEKRGWGVCYSKSQGREYYFNKSTGKSVWHLYELQKLEGVPIRGRSVDRDEPAAKKRKLEEDNGQRAQEESDVFSGETVQFVQRRDWSSVSCHEMAELVIKKADAGVLQSHRQLWDVDTPSNVRINVDRTFEEQRQYRHLLPPHPDIECVRMTTTVNLRQKYAELCKSRVGVDEPKESFNRWLLERKVLSISGDPLLPALAEPKISPSMHREILADVPVKLRKARNAQDAKKNVLTYAEAAKAVVEKRGGNSAQRKTVKWSTEDAFQWVRASQTYTREQFEDHLKHLQTQCNPHVKQIVSQAVNEVCTKMAKLADEKGTFLCQEHRQLYQLPPHSPTDLKSPTEHSVAFSRSFSLSSDAEGTGCDKKDETDVNEESSGRWNYEKAVHVGLCSQMRLNERPFTPSLPLVSVDKEGERVRLSYKNLSHAINQTYFDKLEMLYRIHCPKDEDLMDFDARVWCLLTRYQSMFGVKIHEGSGLQGSLPVSVFQALKKHFGVTMECFASPLNCYFRQFCSAFADTDGYFGSRG